MITPQTSFTETPVHQSQQMNLSIDEHATLGWRGQRLQMFPTELMEIRVLIDMNRHVWSAYLDGEELHFEAPMPKQLLEVQPNPILSAIVIGSHASVGHRPPFDYSLYNLRLVRVAE